MRRATLCAWICWLVCLVILWPAAVPAATVQIPGFYGAFATPARTELPVLKNPAVLPAGIAGFDTATPNKLVIRQNQEKAMIDWSSFNIGADAWTQFDQQGNKNWVALNRIWSRDPSLIFGKLTADGKIYLINQNGILFGPGSQINVHTLVASALNITDNNFLNDIYINKNKVLSFKLEDYQGTGLDSLATVANHGDIAASGGSVFLLAPRVENGGAIKAPAGQIGLVAGTDVSLAQPDADDLSRSGYYVIINDNFNNPLNTDATFGKAVNLPGGTLQADGGMVGLYGFNVEQMGIIRSVTAYQNQRGYVELRAANKITTGTDSVIALPVNNAPDPETGKPVTVSDTFDIQSGVDLKGLHGWSVNNTIIDTMPAKQIEHRGVIEAPAGQVSMSASERVYLESGSRVDVSGVVVDLPTPVIDGYKLNSVELRDAYGQKGGVLQGQKITTSVVSGSTIGDLSQYILTQDRTALERSIGGSRRTIVDAATGAVTYNNPQTSTISLSASNGDIIVKSGAVLDVSGGAIRYQGGSYDATKLLAGTTIYDISSAPLSLHYDKMLGDNGKTYDRYGIREKYTGLYYGGVTPFKTHVDSYTVGGDAGQLTLSAATIILDGQVNGGVTTGTYQNVRTMRGSFSGDTAAGDYDLAVALSSHRGLEMPQAGTLIVNTATTNEMKGKGSSITISSAATPQTNLLPDTPLSSATTVLSSGILNAAGLSTLNLTADLAISTEQNVAIRLQAGGQFSANARIIDHQGRIIVPAGSISLVTGQNATSKKAADGSDNPAGNVIELAEKERIILGPSSLLDVSGERIDNSLIGTANGGALKTGQTTGGSIRILDETDEGIGVFIKSGATVDVSAGYVIDRKGSIAGGNAGMLAIQGANIELGGDLRGYALASESGKILGGAVSLQASNIRVAPQAYDLAGTLVLAGDRFADTGFTQIKLSSFNDVIIESGTTLRTSPIRLANPMSTLLTGVVSTTQESSSVGTNAPGRTDLILLKDAATFMAGPSVFTINAGKAFEGTTEKFIGNLRPVADDSPAKIVLSAGAAIITAPAATAVTRMAADVTMNPSAVGTGISLSGPSVEIQGILASLGGSIQIEATKRDLTIGPGAQIIARGYNRPDAASTTRGLTQNAQPVTGGSVSFSAYGNLTMDEGALIDISGSDSVENRLLSADGKTYPYREAGDPGSLNLSFGGDLTWAATVHAVNTTAPQPGVRGGALSVNQARADLNLTGKDFQHYQSAGFDDVTLKSFTSLVFNGDIDAAMGAVGRKLTLDAPVIKGSGGVVDLSAPWLLLTNRTGPVSMAGGATQGRITMAGNWIDVIGSVQFSSYQDVTLQAVRDIRLSEALYNNNVEKGILAATGNLILDGDRIYPGAFYTYKGGLNSVHTGLYSDFTIRADKKVTITHTLGNGHSGSLIYSAGGSLTVAGAEGIEMAQGGYLAAPMGSVTLNAPGQRIYLASGSTISTAGASGAAINYGVIDDSNLWLTDDKISIQNAVSVNADTLPAKSIALNADTVLVKDGAVLDASGGGSVFAYKFQQGIEGSSDPLVRTGRYLVFKDNAFSLPGAAIYLTGGGGLSAGWYTILPLDAKNPQNGRYAFLSGAYILDLQKSAGVPLSGPAAYTSAGYPVTVGYSGVADTSIRGTRPQVYSVRTATDVLTEGHYYLPDALVSGNGGDITIKSNTAVIDGTLRAAALNPNYRGGIVSLSGANVFIQATSGTPLSAGLDFTTPVPDELKNNLHVAASGISGQGFREIVLGDETTTEQVTIRSGSVLEASVISLSARKGITVESGVSLQAIATTGLGEIRFNAPAGAVVVEAGASLHASHVIELNSATQDIRGDLTLDHSALTLKGDKIIFIPDGYVRSGEGLYITDSLWKQYSAIDDIILMSGSDIIFRDNFTAAMQNALNTTLTLDAARILGQKDGGASVALAANTVNLKNSGSSSTATTDTGAGTLRVDADRINIGGGDTLFGGFSAISLRSRGDVTFLGQGSLTTGKAGLAIQAASVTTGAVATVNSATSTSITPARFTVYTGANFLNEQDNPQPANTIAIETNGNAPGDVSPSGGTLAFWGTSINVGGIVRADGGTIKMTATGTGNADGIYLQTGAQILARGLDYAPGGQVALTADQGRIELAAGSLIDVSAGLQGDAGAVALKAPGLGVAFLGNLQGAAKGGTGGALSLDTNRLADLGDFNAKLAAGGFTEAADIRVRAGDVAIGSGTVIRMNRFKLTADAGSISVSGTIDAHGSDGGGSVELYAAGNMSLQNGGRIDVRGMAGDVSGGEVFLSSRSGFVTLAPGSLIDASASGTVRLRALRNGTDVQMNLGGTMSGLSALLAEAVRVYENVLTVDAAAVAAWDVANTAYMTHETAIGTRLLKDLVRQGWTADAFRLLPGIEARSGSDMTLATAIDLTNRRYGASGVPGILTLRAAGNLNINQSLVDHPTAVDVLTVSRLQDSWALNLAAGADTGSADPSAVTARRVDQSGKPTGNLTIANQAVIYTESAPIRFFSGNDVIIGAGVDSGYMINGDMKYSLASYDGAILGSAGRDLIISGGAIQTATGGIRLQVGRDIQLNFRSGLMGAIRTTGQATATIVNGDGLTVPDLQKYWTYGGGGSIVLDVGRRVGTATEGYPAIDISAWDYFTKQTVTLPKEPGQTRPTKLYYGLFSANYENHYDPEDTPTSGIAAMGGGNVTVRTGGDFLTQAGTFGTGNLTVYAGGSIKGRFLSRSGRGELHAMGNVGAYNAGNTYDRVQIELFDSRFNVTAQGEMQIAAIVNPTLASHKIHYKTDDDFENCTYTANTAIYLKAGTDVTIAGKSVIYDTGAIQETVLPATVQIEAGGDISLLNHFTLTSSPTGNLRLVAGGDIRGASQTNADLSHMILMSDIAPEYWYGLFKIYGTSESGTTWISNRTANDTLSNNKHGYYKDTDKQAAACPLHAILDSDTDEAKTLKNQPVTISAGGNITNLKLYLPKKTEITAQGDIINVTYEGQNNNADDISRIQAGGSISMPYVRTYTSATGSDSELEGLIQGGPGTFIVQAGNSIDLGTLKDGIQSIGNGRYARLGTEESRLVVIAGYAFNKTSDDIQVFFDTIRQAGDDYAQLSAAGKLSEAAALLAKTREETIAPSLTVSSGTGDINMTSSQIGTSIGQSDIFIIAARDLNLGKTALPVSGKVNKTTGITTGGGGGINIFAGRDVNVNESRIMTFYGGDITVWSDYGNINAGRGSRTAVSAAAPKVADDGTKVFSPPAIGSGIRAVTYGENAPEPGNIHLFAPSGIIDAGEAEISGGKVILAATQVLNAQNIVFSSGSVGVSQPTAGAGSLGTLSGAGTVTSGTAKLSQEAASVATARSDRAAQMIEEIMTRWLDVKVIDFILDE